MCFKQYRQTKQETNPSSFIRTFLINEIVFNICLYLILIFCNLALQRTPLEHSFICCLERSHLPPVTNSTLINYLGFFFSKDNANAFSPPFFSSTFKRYYIWKMFVPFFPIQSRFRCEYFPGIAYSWVITLKNKIFHPSFTKNESSR